MNIAGLGTEKLALVGCSWCLAPGPLYPGRLYFSMGAEEFIGDSGLTGSKRRKAKIKRVQCSGDSGIGEGPEDDSERSEIEASTFHRLKQIEETSKSWESVDEAPLDEDPRVIVGLNRLINIIVSPTNVNPKVGAEDD